MATNYRTEIGPVTEDDTLMIVRDLNTTQVVSRVNFEEGRAYIAFWAEGRPEAESAIRRAFGNIAADFRIKG